MSLIDDTGFLLRKGPTLAVERRTKRLEKERQLRQARAFVKKRDGGKCKCCGKRGAEVHHLKYRSMGGDHDPNNLALLCKRCHDDIHGHLIEVTFGGKNLARTVRFKRKPKSDHPMEFKRPEDLTASEKEQRR